MADEPPVTQLTTRVPHSLRQRVKMHCVRTDVTVSAFIAAAIREHLAREAAPADTR